MEYSVEADILVFHCMPVDENDAAALLLNHFLLDMSKGQNVFFHAYRLPVALEIIDPAVILAKAEVLLDPFNTFFHLSYAAVKSDRFDFACETSLYYFNDTVAWPDFLASSPIRKTKHLMKKGLLSACFSSCDHGADLWFECDTIHENRVKELFNDMSDLGWEIKRLMKLTLPYEND